MTDQQNDYSIAWLQAGYELLSEEGISSLKMDKLILRAGLPRRNFYKLFVDRNLYLKKLIQYHRRQVLSLCPALNHCSAYIPDLFELLTHYPREIRFHRQLLLAGEDGFTFQVYREINARVNAVVFPLWADYVDYCGDPEDGKNFHLALMELWLLHLDPQNLSYNALMRNAEAINRWLVWFRNGDIGIDDHLKIKGGRSFFNP